MVVLDPDADTNLRRGKTVWTSKSWSLKLLKKEK